MMASFCCNVIVDGIVFTAGIFIPEIKKELKGNAASVALVSSLLSGFYLMAGPFVAALANRYGFRPVTIMGSFIAATAFSLCYFAESVLYLHICYGVLGYYVKHSINFVDLTIYFCHRWNWILLHLHAISHNCWLLF